MHSEEGHLEYRIVAAPLLLVDGVLGVPLQLKARSEAGWEVRAGAAVGNILAHEHELLPLAEPEVAVPYFAGTPPPRKRIDAPEADGSVLTARGEGLAKGAKATLLTPRNIKP